MANSLKQAFDQTGKALAALKIAMENPMQENRVNIDGTIHRFEFSFELFWKLLKRVLEAQGIQKVYPKEILQAAYAGNMIDEEDLWLSMLKDRNLTTHTYQEAMADAIYSRIPDYYDAMQKAFIQLQKQYSVEL